MKRLLLWLMLVPALCVAEIPVVAPVLGENLTPLDGKPFSGSVNVQFDGDEIAVLDLADDTFGDGHGAIHTFAKLGGHWKATAKFEPPGGADGTFRDFEFHDDVIVVSTKPDNEERDGTRLRSYVLERAKGEWVQTIVVPDYVTGLVRVRGDWMAVPRRRDIEMFQRIGFANWQPAGQLAQLGNSYLFTDNLRGPLYDFDGRRILISTDASVNGPPGTWSYFNVAGRVYELDDSNHWTLTSLISTREAFNELIVRPELTSLSGRNASLLGHLFRDNGHGYWEEIADLSPVNASLLNRMSVQVLSNGMALVVPPDYSHVDLYVSDADGYWQPRLRMNCYCIAASQGAEAVVIRYSGEGEPEPPGTLVLTMADLNATAARAHSPARVSNLTLSSPSVAVGGEILVSAWVYAGWGVTVRNVEYRVEGGPWLPMNPDGGAFDEVQEYAWARLRFPEQIFGSRFICLRVTDSRGRQTEVLDRQGDPCPLIVGRPQPVYPVRVPDDQPPQVGTPMLAKTQLHFGEDNVIYAFADDSGSGEICTGQYDCSPTSLIAMQFRIDNGVWRAMKTWPEFRPGRFLIGGEMSAAHGDFPPATELGSHTACVRAMDSLGNVSVPKCVSYQTVP